MSRCMTYEYDHRFLVYSLWQMEVSCFPSCSPVACFYLIIYM